MTIDEWFADEGSTAALACNVLLIFINVTHEHEGASLLEAKEHRQ